MLTQLEYVVILKKKLAFKSEVQNLLVKTHQYVEAFVQKKIFGNSH